MGYHHLPAISCSDTAIVENFASLAKSGQSVGTGTEIEDFKHCDNE